MTITAMNYAAQAQFGLIKAGKVMSHWGFKEDSEYLSTLSKRIGKAIHFAIPDNGRVFNDGLKGLDGAVFRLPYPEITIEYFLNNEAVVSPDMDDIAAAPAKVVLLLKETHIQDDVYEIEAHTIHYLKKPDLWSCGILHAVFNNVFNETSIKYVYNTPQMTANDFNVGRLNEGHVAMIRRGTLQTLIGAFEFIEAMSCINVKAEPINKIDQAKANRRFKDGKLPIYETRILTVDTSAHHNEKLGMTVTDRASVRQHLRRGHIRRHPTAGNIWVQSCVVGYSELGVINKSYEVH